jgi:hypothetical protein
MNVSIKELYDQGSKSCQQYSELVTRVRTLAQQTFLALAVGTGVALSRSDATDDYIGTILILGGVGLMLFGAAMWVLNQHYSDAFQAIRDECLVPLETELLRTQSLAQMESVRKTLSGPWTSHQRVRRRNAKGRWWAWHGPFLALIATGLIAAAYGATMIRR